MSPRPGYENLEAFNAAVHEIVEQQSLINPAAPEVISGDQAVTQAAELDPTRPFESAEEARAIRAQADAERERAKTEAGQAAVQQQRAQLDERVQRMANKLKPAPDTLFPTDPESFDTEAVARPARPYTPRPISEAARDSGRIDPDEFRQTQHERTRSVIESGRKALQGAEIQDPKAS